MCDSIEEGKAQWHNEQRAIEAKKQVAMVKMLREALRDACSHLPSAVLGDLANRHLVVARELSVALNIHVAEEQS
jgi:hypothetical protein